jgi:hypothetical protein
MSSSSPSDNGSNNGAFGARDRTTRIQPVIWSSDPAKPEGWTKGPFWAPDLGYQHEGERWVVPGQELRDQTSPLVFEVGEGGKPVHRSPDSGDHGI